MKKIQDAAGFVFIIAIGILAVVSILGVWDFFGHDVITKSFETLGLLAVVAIVVIAAGKFIEGKPVNGAEMPAMPNPAFRSIRRGTVGILIVAASLLALLGVLSIWDVISDKQVLYKSLGSLAILAFTSLITVMTCLEREDNKMLKGQGGKGMSVGAVVLGLIFMYVLFSFSRFFF